MTHRFNFVRRLEASHSYGFVMLPVVLTILLTVALPESSPWRLTIVVTQSLTALLACWTSKAPKKLFDAVVIISGLAVVAAVAIVVLSGSDSTEAHLLYVAGVLMIMGVIFRGIALDIRAEGVRAHALFGALTVYLLFGTLCAFLYGFEGSIGLGPVFAGSASAGALDNNPADNIYFSFVTLTTVGYGDLTPVSGVVRATAIFEALVGQLYLVGVVATLGGALGRGKRVTAGESVPAVESAPVVKSVP